MRRAFPSAITIKLSCAHPCSGYGHGDPQASAGARSWALLVTVQGVSRTTKQSAPTSAASAITTIHSITRSQFLNAFIRPTVDEYDHAGDDQHSNQACSYYDRTRRCVVLGKPRDK